jgi:hypothetical protein
MFWNSDNLQVSEQGSQTRGPRFDHNVFCKQNFQSILRKDFALKDMRNIFCVHFSARVLFF